MDLQSMFVIAFVAVAGGFLAFRAFRTAKSADKKKDCGADCGCGK